MTAMVLITLLVAVACVTILVLVSRPRHRVLLDELERHSVVVHTRDDKSIRGVLVAARPDGLLLDHADMLVTASEVVSIGSVVVPRASVSFIQRLASAS